MVQNNGVQYMYSDSRIIDQSPEIEPFLDSLILQAGSVHVYKLKEDIELD
jgi:hypothetical protein